MTHQVPTVFIHTNEKQFLGAKVSEYSLRKASKNSDNFDVKIISVEDYPQLMKRHGKEYLREGKKVPWNIHDLQSFTPVRFLPPELMGYKGRAVVIDPDVFALKDIYTLLTRDMEGKSVMCRKIYPKDGRTPYYATSVMLMDCAKLQHWKWNESIDEMFAFKRDYRDWISLSLEPEESVGILEEEWNHFDLLNDDTCLLHNTGRITQPWKSGLPIDFTSNKMVNKSLPPKWGVIPRQWIARAKAFMKRQPYAPNGFYREHPDPNQVSFFFSLVKECLEEDVITEDFLLNEMKKKHVRADAMEIIKSIKS